MALIKIKSGGVDNTTNLGRRNLIINGAMDVAQRGTSTTGIANGASGIFPSTDRVKFWNQGGGSQQYTHSQSSNVPNTQFRHSTRLECTTADTSLPSAHYSLFRLGLIEAQDCKRIGFGSASAQPLTFSFWCRSSQTGSQDVLLVTHGNIQRNSVKTFTISAANTWQYVTITYPADTDASANISGETDNSMVLSIDIFLTAGATYQGGTAPANGAWDTRSGNSNYRANNTLNIAGAVGRYFEITGAQLEVGNTATPFEHLSFAEDLYSCQRYFETNYDQGVALGTAVGNAQSYGISYRATQGSTNYYSHPFKVPKRATPTVTIYNGVTGATGTWRGSGSADRSITTANNTHSMNILGPSNNDFIRSGFYGADAEL